TMRKRIGEQDVEIWLRSAVPLSLDLGGDPSALVVEVANRYYSEWIQENYLHFLVDSATEVLGERIAIEFVSQEDPATAEAALPVDAAPNETQPRGLGLNRVQSFDSFVIGECNKFAH